MHVGQSMITTAIAECQGFMVDSHLVKNSGVNIMNIDRVLDDGVTEFIRCSIVHPSAKSAPREKDRIAIDVMVTTGTGMNLGRMRRPSHFTSQVTSRR